MRKKELLTIDSFSQIEKCICKDLCWYLVYEAVMNTREELHFEGDMSDLPENKAALYYYALKVYLERVIEEHIFMGYKVEMSVHALHQALEYFSLHIPLVPTFHLSLYLNYLEGWSQNNPNWTKSSPAAFENFEFEVRP